MRSERFAKARACGQGEQTARMNAREPRARLQLLELVVPRLLRRRLLLRLPCPLRLLLRSLGVRTEGRAGRGALPRLALTLEALTPLQRAWIRQAVANVEIG